MPEISIPASAIGFYFFLSPKLVVVHVARVEDGKAGEESVRTSKKWSPKYNLFVHDGMNSVADYNSLRVGVGCVYVVWMSPCKFHDRITSKRLEILGWNFVWWLILMIYSWNEPIEKIRPPQPPYPLTNHMRLANFHNLCPILMKLGMEVPFGGDENHCDRTQCKLRLLVRCRWGEKSNLCQKLRFIH